jgi:hypothetical protein
MSLSERAFLQDVLQSIEGLPEGLSERLLELLADPSEDRADAIRRVIEEHSRD